MYSDLPMLSSPTGKANLSQKKRAIKKGAAAPFGSEFECSGGFGCWPFEALDALVLMILNFILMSQHLTVKLVH